MTLPNCKDCRRVLLWRYAIGVMLIADMVSSVAQIGLIRQEAEGNAIWKMMGLVLARVLLGWAIAGIGIVTLNRIAHCNQIEK